eukprot:m.38512 g.38512  ORF g.38512 m.38512 type:complete len:76 (+) comp45297_c0_seq1:621-848(+)
MGSKGERTMFSLDIKNGVDIQKYSAYKEAEILLLPGTCFEVVSVACLSQDGLYMIQLEEKPVPGLIDLARPSTIQ